MTSIIPFFILLLTTCALSAPVGQEYGSSTVKYDYVTGRTTVNKHLMPDYKSTGLPIVQKPRSVEDSDEDEVTKDSVTRSPRVFPPSSYPTSVKTYEKRSDDYSLDSKETETSEKRESKESVNPSSTETYKKRTADKDEDSEENQSSEKRESKDSLNPSSTETYKKRNIERSEDSQENQENEKRDIDDAEEKQENERRDTEESSTPSSTETYKKRDTDEARDSQEDRISDRRGLEPSDDSQEVEDNDKRNYEDSQEVEDNDKRSYEDSQAVEDNEKRSSKEYDYSKENEKRESKESLTPSSTEAYKRRTVEDNVFTTLESSAQFNQRAIRPVESQEEPRSSTIYSQKQTEMISDVQPSSSVDSFGKFTGLRNDEQTGRFMERSTPQLPIRAKQVSKTGSFVPGKVNNVPTQSSAFIRPIQQEQLSRGQSQSVS